MKRTVYRIQCATPNGLTSFDRYAWNGARNSIVATLRETGKAWLKIEYEYLAEDRSHYHGSEVWECKEDGSKIRFVINRLDANGNPYRPR